MLGHHRIAAQTRLFRPPTSRRKRSILFFPPPSPPLLRDGRGVETRIRSTSHHYISEESKRPSSSPLTLVLGNQGSAEPAYNLKVGFSPSFSCTFQVWKNSARKSLKNRFSLPCSSRKWVQEKDYLPPFLFPWAPPAKPSCRTAARDRKSPTYPPFPGRKDRGAGLPWECSQAQIILPYLARKVSFFSLLPKCHACDSNLKPPKLQRRLHFPLLINN